MNLAEMCVEIVDGFLGNASGSFVFFLAAQQFYSFVIAKWS